MILSGIHCLIWISDTTFGNDGGGATTYLVLNREFFFANKAQWHAKALQDDASLFLPTGFTMRC